MRENVSADKSSLLGFHSDSKSELANPGKTPDRRPPLDRSFESQQITQRDGLSKMVAKGSS